MPPIRFTFNDSATPGLARPIEAYLVMSNDGGVPGGSTEQFLRLGEGIISSVTGLILPRALDLTGLTLTVETMSANTYVLEVLTDPAGKAGGPTVLATVTLLPATDKVSILFPLGVNPIPLGVEVGGRVVRTIGAGAGLGEMVAVGEFRGSL